MQITILSIGARPKTETSSMANDFLKRLPAHVKVSWKYFAHGVGSPVTSKKHEAEKLLSSLPAKAIVVLLDERGKQLSSPELAKKIFTRGDDIVFIIGGAYGVDDSVVKRTDLVWSLGMLVYPHRLVRIILAEQLYRAHCIHTGHPYHHA